MKYICKNCNKEFELSEVQTKKYIKNPNKNFFCSKSCAALFNKNHINRIPNKQDNKGRYIKKEYKYKTWICKNCNKEFELNLNQQRRLEKDSSLNVFCSKSCSAKYSNSHRDDSWKELKKKTNKILHDDENYVNKKAISETVKKLYEDRDDYGFDSEAYKEKMLKKYGVENIGRSEWMKQHNLEKYGTEYYFQSEAYLKRKHNTNLKKYGYVNHMQNKEQIKKFREHIREKYGVEWVTDIPGVKEKIAEKYVERISNFNNKRQISKIQQHYIDLFKQKGLIVEAEFPLARYFYDIKIDNNLIEINPTITHNTYFNPYGKCISDTYHLEKLNTANSKGFRCIHIFDWDDADKIVNLINTKKTLYARRLIIKEVSLDDCSNFLNKYHLQNSCKGQKVRLGLYHNTELIQIMTFGKPRYNKNYEWELLRLCTHKDYKVVGGAEKLFKHFIEVISPKSIISYCDFSKFTGEVYDRLGFVKQGIALPSKHWVKGEQHITDNLLRQRGYDQLFKTNYGKGTSNEELMLENGWLPIYDCGQLTFIWRDNK